MGDDINFRRGTTAQRLTETLGVGTPGWDNTTSTLYVGDGSTTGGIKIGGLGDTAAYTVYVATSTLGGTAGGTGRQMQSGTTTSANNFQLINGNASFDASVDEKTVYNTTDGTWTRITSVSSSTVLNISADIMATGEDYVIVDSVDDLAAAWAVPSSPYLTNITVRCTPGTIPNNGTLRGLKAGGDYSITIQGDNTAGGGGTTISGDLTIYDGVTIQGGTNYDLIFTGTVDFAGDPSVTMDYVEFQDEVTLDGSVVMAADHTEFKAKLATQGNVNCSWTNTTTTSPSKLYIYDNAVNSFDTCTVTIGNDPTNITEVSSTITRGYSLYVGTSSIGGSDSANDGLATTTGTTTSTSANKLIDSGASFNSNVAVGMTVRVVDGQAGGVRWGKVNSVDSDTQLTLSSDIVSAAGDTYAVANAKATTTGAMAAIPGSVNCDTTVLVSDETHSDDWVLSNRGLTGDYTITVCGGFQDQASGTKTASGGTAHTRTADGTVTVSGAGWTADQFKGMWVRFLDNTSTAGLQGVANVIRSNTADTLTIVGGWNQGKNLSLTPVSGDTFRIMRPETVFSGECTVKNQKGVAVDYGRFTSAAATVALLHDSGSIGEVSYCDLSHGRVFGNSNATFNDCYVHGNVPRGIYASSATAAVPGCLIDMAASTYGGTHPEGVEGANKSSIFSSGRTFVVENCNRGVYARGQSFLGTWQGGLACKNDINNCTTYGQRADFGSMGQYTGISYVRFSSNGTDQSADATTYSYLDAT